jgi:hypothetical protein
MELPNNAVSHAIPAQGLWSLNSGILVGFSDGTSQSKHASP